MSSPRFTPEFKDEAVRQIVERGYSVAEVSERLGVSGHSLYKWIKAVRPDKTEEQAAALVEAKGEVLKLCNDPAVSAQVRLLKHTLQQAFSYRAPGVGAGGYRTGSSRR